MSKHRSLEKFLAGEWPYEISISETTFKYLSYSGFDMSSMLSLSRDESFMLFTNFPGHCPKVSIVKFHILGPNFQTNVKSWHFHGHLSYSLEAESMRTNWFIRRWI